MAEPRKKSKWIKTAIQHPGALYRELHVPEGTKIPKAKLEKAAHSDNPKLRHRAELAETLEGLHTASRAGKLYRGKSIRRHDDG